MAPTTVGVGYRFRPLDQELVCYYLSRKTKHQPLAYNGIPDCDVYGDKCPWEIFDEKKKHYVFTRLKKISKNRVARSAGVGTWHGSNSGVEIHDAKNKNKVIGLKKTFSFKVKPKFMKDDCVKNETVGNWIMYEYSLVSGENSSDYVLCSIHKKKIKKSDDQEEEEEDDDDDEDNDWDVDDDECEPLNISTETSVNEREAAGTAMTVMIPPDATQSLCSVDVGEYGMEREVPSTDMTVMIPPDAPQPSSSIYVGEYGMGNSQTSDDLDTEAQLSAVYEDLMRDWDVDDECEALNRSTETSVNEREAASTAMTVMIPPYATQPLSSVDVGEYGMGNPQTSDDLAQFNAVYEYLMRDDELPALREVEFSMPGWTGFVDCLMDSPHQPVQESDVFLPTATCI